MSVAIVTGVSRGFGKAVVQVLLDAGWHVVGDARDVSAVQMSGAENLDVLAGDILDEAHLQELVERARDRGGLDLLVNNAGALGPSPLPRLRDVEPAVFAELFRVNTVAQLRLIQLALPVLADGACVVNVTSDAGVEHYEGWGAYGATKAALDLVTGVLGVEVPGVRWYALDPGDIRTDMHQAAFPGEDISDRADPADRAPAVLRLVEGSLPSGRYRAEELLFEKSETGPLA